MFDFFQIVDFKNSLPNECNYSFLKNPLYKKISCIENTRKFDNSYAVYLERDGKDGNLYESGGKCVFIYGTVYTNKRFEKSHGEKPGKLNSEKLFRLLDEYGEGFTDFIKGSFVIIFFDTHSKSLRMVSDRLNVLPLYFAFKNDVLVISSSVRMILETGYVSKEINPAGLTEQMIFDYTLGTKTFFKDIERIDNGMMYDLSVNGLKKKRYWSVEQLYNENLLPKKESLEMLSKTLYENTNLYSSDTEKLLLAVTGGFDGRANLALLNKKKEDFLCYSYGMQGSQQVEVPKEICERLNLNYEPVILDEEYEAQHDECTLEAIEHSNATAPILRSNYPYAYKKLNSFSRTIMTGLFGSEVMRPLHNLGIMMNDYSEKLFLSDNPESELREIIEDIKKKNYIKSEIIESCYEEIRDELFKNYFDKYKKYDKVYRFFFFIIKEGVRKYFSQEIQIERIYVTTRFPFFDDDFVELMYKTPFAGMYNGFLGKSKFKRRKGQLLYAYIYRKFKPELGKIKLDRGYKPDDLLKPFPFNFISIYRGIKKTAAYKREKGNDTFNSEKWTENFISGSIYKTEDKMNVFGEGLKQKYEDKSYLKDLLKYSHIISLKKYFSTI